MNKDYKALGLAREDLVRMYRTMTLIREFEENAVAYFKQGIVIGNMHMYVGEEATATGVCYALKKEDYVASTHRCDGHLIAKGADTKAMMAELMGRENGICGGLLRRRRRQPGSLSGMRQPGCCCKQKSKKRLRLCAGGAFLLHSFSESVFSAFSCLVSIDEPKTKKRW